MSGILDLAQVLVGDGHWTAGAMDESLGGLVQVELADICSQDLQETVTGDDAGAYGFDIVTFSIVAHLIRPTRCQSGSEDALVSGILENTTEQAVGQALFSTGSDYQRTVDGSAVNEMTLKDTAVATVTGASVMAKLLAALDKYYTLSLGAPPIVHLGRTAAAAVALAQFFASGSGESLVTGERVSLSPGYPTGAIAVTGPIQVRLGSIAIDEKYDTSVNRTYVDATRLAAYGFDPAIAVTGSTT